MMTTEVSGKEDEVAQVLFRISRLNNVNSLFTLYNQATNSF